MTPFYLEKLYSIGLRSVNCVSTPIKKIINKDPFRFEM